MLRYPFMDNRGNRRLALRSHHLQRLFVAHGERQGQSGALLVVRQHVLCRDGDGLLYLLLLGLAVGSVFLKHIRHGLASFNHLIICTIIHHFVSFIETQHASDLRLFRRESRNLPHRVHPPNTLLITGKTNIIIYQE